MKRKSRGRRSIRLSGHDYSQAGAYFITICTHGRKLLFGRIKNGTLYLNDEGNIAEKEWLRTAVIRPEIRLDEFVIMPNHIHAVFFITARMGSDDSVGAHGHAPLRRPARSVGSLVARFKDSVTRQIRKLRLDPNFTIWQRNYYDRVIPNQDELDALRRYIRQNPLRWERDKYYLQD